jgi:hypothetical protein
VSQNGRDIKTWRAKAVREANLQAQMQYLLAVTPESCYPIARSNKQIHLYYLTKKEAAPEKFDGSMPKS